ncbi:uncharacterized protein MYCGRDRAFT_95697 [Zymoseptoria tritici IPO323]|uniref:Uncharacterized protein n=1 Tax=Zymoseptoria tritici (strain CBS 115943 / IPO323) TaxID=336722 RepID=F9XJZ6_ZYMTI|nr:uncharacterized protein MYCGRDRAFT_95697 [Zymoseptoria tritici IPO323]EGP84356.1 hypothetical protein MYCGRDRAFT_95697 [Zymoseptoria tritici IPO323]
MKLSITGAIFGLGLLTPVVMGYLHVHYHVCARSESHQFYDQCDFKNAGAICVQLSHTAFPNLYTNAGSQATGITSVDELHCDTNYPNFPDEWHIAKWTDPRKSCTVKDVHGGPDVAGQLACVYD